MTQSDDPVPYGLVLDLENAWRVLAALEDALLELENLAAAPGLRDELATPRMSFRCGTFVARQRSEAPPNAQSGPENRA